VSRALTFAEADIVATARERTVPVAQDNFAVSMRQDDEGNFLRALLPQVGGPGPKSAGRQGIFLLTASGTVLGFAGACDDMKAVREVFAAALARWDALPAEARTAQVPAMGAAGARYASTPPADALTLDVTTRLLERDEKGVLRDSSLMALRPHSRFHPGPQLDRAWLQMVDWRALVPNPLTPGASKHLVRGFLDRLAASYLFDSTTGFRQIWADNEIRDARLTSTVERVEGDEAHLIFQGRVDLRDDAGSRSYSPALHGRGVYDSRAQRFTSFCLLALGDRRGLPVFKRLGDHGEPQPLAVLFEMTPPGAAYDGLPPSSEALRFAIHSPALPKLPK